MFGFPRGQYKIERPALIETSDVVKEWRLRFERPANRIRASDVHTDMLEDVEGGFWFKSQFLVLLSFCLIENFGNNYVPSHMLDCFDDVDIVSDFNWCAHVVKFLIDHTTSWKENIGKYFTGSTLFITGYCDGPCKEEDVVGVVDGGMHHENEGNNNVNESVPPIVIGVDKQVNPVNAGIVDNLTDMHTVAIGLLKQGKVISDALSNIMVIVRKLPPGILDNVAFRKTVEASMLHIATILEIEEATMKRDQLQKELCSMPSFSFGLTQDWNGIINLARDATNLAEKETDMNIDLPHDNTHHFENVMSEDNAHGGG
ncbi:hypothetical protein C2S51_035085 [Perilla frutescens var. frutescens]|nr:hypothetical protein C2S51_035085 [Perilla frutescens var. frutescens]